MGHHPPTSGESGPLYTLRGCQPVFVVVFNAGWRPKVPHQSLKVLAVYPLRRMAFLAARIGMDMAMIGGPGHRLVGTAQTPGLFLKKLGFCQKCSRELAVDCRAATSFVWTTGSKMPSQEVHTRLTVAVSNCRAELP